MLVNSSRIIKIYFVHKLDAYLGFFMRTHKAYPLPNCEYCNFISYVLIFYMKIINYSLDISCSLHISYIEYIIIPSATNLKFG